MNTPPLCVVVVACLTLLALVAIVGQVMLTMRGYDAPAGLLTLAGAATGALPTILTVIHAKSPKPPETGNAPGHQPGTGRVS